LARSFDLENNLTFFSSHTIQILEGHSYKPKILQIKFGRPLIGYNNLTNVPTSTPSFENSEMKNRVT
jgi:hypothetical protein